MSEWRDSAACKGKTSLFFGPHAERGPKRDERIRAAQAMCAGCSVRNNCAAEATGEYGIWAGEDEDAFVLT